MKKQKFWQTLEALPDGAAQAEWALELGNEFERVRTFLQPTVDEVKSFPCTSRPRCDCQPHRIEVVRVGERVAVCDCGQCAPLRLTRADLTVHELNRTLLAESLTRLCGWRQSPTDPILPGVWRLGTWNDLRANLYWCAGGRADRVRRMVDSLFAIDRSPFILVLPTRANLTSNLDEALKREGCCALPLDEHFAIDANGKLKLEQTIDGIREEFLERAATRRDTANVLRGIDAKIEGAEQRKLEQVTALRNVFSKAGSHWDVTFEGGKTFHLPHTLGAEYLNYLLHHPSEAISAYDLEMTIRPDKAKARPKDTVQNNLDAETIREYLRQVEKLRAQREEASEDGDMAKVGQLDEDIEAIENELKKNGQAPDAGERSRGNVSKAVAAVQRKLRKGDAREKRLVNTSNNLSAWVTSAATTNHKRTAGDNPLK